MSEYKKLDLSALTYSDKPLSYEEALKGKKPFDFFERDFDDGLLQVKEVEKDIDRKCVKLVIS